MKFMTHHMYRHCNHLLIILCYTVNCFPALIRDKNCLFDEKVEEEDDMTIEDVDSILNDFENEFPTENLQNNPWTSDR